MNNRTIQLNLSKFRAINEANIDLNGISVVLELMVLEKVPYLKYFIISSKYLIILKQKFIKTMKVIMARIKAGLGLYNK